ncbi:ROK family protein [Glycomyces sp. NRRL B-16210]|uniref:ROK family transcriptional regulator n=1 Tax=Glycomyces sp. NRRL B-16210 TaxID=1463821 RepID=UPI001414FAC9|nr:ROK family protein [Glycomyces sp. NRRL B-16210]
MLRHLLADHPSSRPHLAVKTGLSVATVSNLVAELIDLGVVVEAGWEDSGGGRPRMLLAPNTEGGVLIGVDVATTYVKFEAYDLALQVLHRIEEQVDLAEDTPEKLLDHIASGMADLRGRLAGREILGLGVSLPGQVDVAGGISVFTPNWNWRDVAFKQLLAERLGLEAPIYLDNSLKTVTAGELWFGDGRGVERLAVVVLGTGVGVGLAFDGKLYRGATNSAGEWGHTVIDADGPVCRCGRRGCIEARIGAPAILREWAAASGGAHEWDTQESGIEALVDAWKAGEEPAVRTVEATARYMAIGVANLVNLVNPDLVVFTGWVSSVLGEALLPELEARLGDHVLESALGALRVKLDEQSRNMVLLGAAALALEGHLNGIKSIGSRSRP